MIKSIKSQMKIILNQKGARITFYFLLVFVLINYYINLKTYASVDKASMPSFIEICAFPIESSRKMQAVANVLLENEGWIYFDNSFMMEARLYSPIIYCLARIGLLALFAACMSIVPMAFSCVCNKFYVYLIIPVYFILSLFGRNQFEIMGYKIKQDYFSYLIWTGESNTRQDVIGCGLNVSKDALIIFAEYLTIYTLWVYAAVLLANVLSIMRNSVFGNVVSLGGIMFFTILLGFTDYESLTGRGIRKLRCNPISYTIMNWYKNVNQAEYGFSDLPFACEPWMGITVLGVCCLAIFVLGAVYIQRMDIINNNTDY